MRSTSANPTRRQVLQVCSGVAFGKRLLASKRQISKDDIKSAIDYGRKWSDGNKFLIEGLEEYQHIISVEQPPTNMRVSVTFLTDWARIALGSALLKMMGRDARGADPEDWRAVSEAGRLITMILAVSPGTGEDAMSMRVYGGGKVYTVLKIDGETLTPVRAESPSASNGKIPANWLPTTRQLLAMIHDTKDTPSEFTRILPPVDGGRRTPYELVFRMDSYELGPPYWTRKAEFLVFDGEGNKRSQKVNLAGLR